ncbi:MAG: DUF2089 domain-containing protein, partial [Blastochloris sp.]|nr:DUF2089 domain-containing protein [Blastochloris sp.]
MSREILEKVARGEMSVEEAERATRPGLTITRAAKGGISLYGLQRMPVTLYPSQWLRVRDETMKETDTPHHGGYLRPGRRDDRGRGRQGRR